MSGGPKIGSSTPIPSPPGLSRSLGLLLLSFYGIGTILGAGIYVLIGQVAGYAGMHTPVAFILAAVLAGLSAFSYAELAARFPRSAAEAIYVQEGLRWAPLSIAVGLLIVTVAVTSTATLISGLSGYVGTFVRLPDWVVPLAMPILLGGIVAWGIRLSVAVASMMTVVEIVGLIVVILAARHGFSALPERIGELWPGHGRAEWFGVMAGAFIAFFAYIGFEDMVNVAEEVKDPRRTLPAGIVIALLTTTMLYIVVALAVVLSVAPADLAASDAPLAMVFAVTTGHDPRSIALVSIVSIANGVLIQIVMASRVLYGMGARGWLPEVLSRVHPRTRTPVYATLLVTVVVMLLAFSMPLVSLAAVASLSALTIFTLINLSLILLKRRGPGSGAFSVPFWLPCTGFVASGAFLVYQGFRFG